ncbi:Hypothetical protein FKW44_004106, partial [Caligus rogercresseyi]
SLGLWQESATHDSLELPLWLLELFQKRLKIGKRRDRKIYMTKCDRMTVI